MIYSFASDEPVLPENGDYWIAPDANVIGRVILHAATSIWFGTTLRGDNEAIVIGAGSNIQDNCVLHTDPGYPLNIGENCTIGHGAILHGCTIGDQTLVGMGAIVMNGATIGRQCQIGAGALISEGKTIPDGSLVVGFPAKIIRQLGTEPKAMILQAALDYQKRMRLYRDGLTESR